MQSQLEVRVLRYLKHFFFLTQLYGILLPKGHIHFYKVIVRKTYLSISVKMSFV